MSDAINIKPHHLIDIITALGGGQVNWEPHPYGHAVHLVARRVLDDPALSVEMNSGADDICGPCIHNQDGLCGDTIDTSFRPEAPSSKREWNLLVDNRWYERLGLKDGDRLSVREFATRAGDRAGGGISDIYREIPPEMTAQRLANLEKGIAMLLGGSPLERT